MSAQKPMADRMQEMLELIWEYHGVSVRRLDKKVLRRLIKRGKVKIENSGGGRRTVSMAVATVKSPPRGVHNTGGPYAKRRAAQEEAGLPYRGKTWGKVRVDLPREERERKIAEKKSMWAKLKHFNRNPYLE